MGEISLAQGYSNALFWANLKVGLYATVYGLGSNKVREVIREKNTVFRSYAQRHEPEFRVGKVGLRAATFSFLEKRAEEARASSDMALYRL